MRIETLDHLVLTVESITNTCAFYEAALGMEVVVFGGNRKALRFGSQKINLHEVDRAFEPKAHRPTPGSADLCFISSLPIQEVIEHLERLGIPIVEGPIRRSGAIGPILSVYIRDPDQNLIELSEKLNE